MLELSGIARSTYYYYLKQKDKDKYESEKQDILEIYNANKGRYGYRRICAVLKAKGYEINHKTVLKLMKALNLRGKQSKNGKYHSYKGEVGKVAENLLHRDFYADKPFEKLTTDVTEFKIGDEKVYLLRCLICSTVKLYLTLFLQVLTCSKLERCLPVCLKSFPPMRALCSIPIKVGSTNTLNTSDYLPNTTLPKACPAKETAWTTA